jgi:hypothetical protein
MLYLELKSEKQINIVGTSTGVVIELKEYPKKLFMIDASKAEKYPYYKDLLIVEKRERQKQGLGFWIIKSPGAKKISLTATTTKLPYTIKGYDEYYTVTDFK